MNKKKIFSITMLLVLVMAIPFLIAGDHLDGPAVTSATTSDISSFYAFEAQNSNNLVLIANIQGFLPAGDATKNATFDEDVLIEFNIDTTGDSVEELVIQATKRGDTMYFFGPTTPIGTGTQSQIVTKAEKQNKVAITPYSKDNEAIVSESEDGMKFFAGPRDDPFFFDLNRFNAIANQEVSGFNTQGTDSFAGQNVLSVAIEIPKNILGSSNVGTNPFEPSDEIYSIWVETKRKQ